MSIVYNNPVCACKDLCTTPNRLRSALTTSEVNQPPSNLINQNSFHPSGFFHLPPEIRNRVYFLAFRPDCMHSFGKNLPCSKRHIHQSSIGRRNAWKWLVLCHQTFVEASLYHPVSREEMKLRVTSEDCARCEYDRGPVLEGALHAVLTPRLGDRYRWEEYWLAGVRDLRLELDTETIDHDQEAEAGPRHDRHRFEHNLASIVAFVAGLRYLEKLTLTVSCTFHKTLSTNISVADSVAQLLCTLYEKKEADSLDFNIIQVVIVTKASVLQPGAPDHVTEGNTVEPLLQIAASVGFKQSEITTSEFQDKRENYSTGADIHANLNTDIELPSYEKILEATLLAKRSPKVQPELRFRIASFDEDFDDLPEDEKRLLKQEKEAVAKGAFVSRNPCGPTFVETVTPCVRHITAKYPGYGSYAAGSDTAPLYLGDDFYYKRRVAVYT